MSMEDERAKSLAERPGRWRAAPDHLRIERTLDDGTIERRPTRYGTVANLRAAIRSANREAG